MSVVKVFLKLHNIAKQNNYSHHLDEVLKNEIRGEYLDDNFLNKMPYKRSLIFLGFLLSFVGVVFFFDSAHNLGVKDTSIVTIASFMVAGLISLIILNTNYKIEMLKLKEKWVFSLREDVQSFIFAYKKVSESAFEEISKAMFYNLEDGFIVPDSIMNKLKKDFSKDVDSEKIGQQLKDLDASYYRLVSKVDDGDVEHREIALNIKLLRHVLSQYILIMETDSFDFDLKKDAHLIFKEITTKETLVCNLIISKKIREVWDKDRNKKTRRNFYTVMLYCLLLSTFIGMIVGLAEFSFIEEIKKLWR